MRLPDENEGIRSQPFIQKIEEAMNDDFNTAVALAHMNEELRHLNKAMTTICKRKTADWTGFDTAAITLKYACQLLGFLYHDPKNYKAHAHWKPKKKHSVWMSIKSRR